MSEKKKKIYMDRDDPPTQGTCKIKTKCYWKREGSPLCYNPFECPDKEKNL